MAEIDNESIDFVYSFIVFQHFSSIEYFYKYFSQIKRIIKPDGVGVIFFGLVGDSCNPDIKNIIQKDGFFHWHEAFSDGSRGSTLYYDPAWVKKQIEDVYNMSIISMSRFSKQPWSDMKELSSQFCVSFINNRNL
jgi:SAM-dependent methyltransferase